MHVEMSLNEVTTKIQQLHQSGASLNKKKVKLENPALVQHALYYYPSWDHALKSTGIPIH